MATMNPFDLLGDNEDDDPSQLIIAAQRQQNQKAATKKPQAPAQTAVTQSALGNFPSKPLPPAQAVREAKSETNFGRGGRTAGRGFGRARGAGFNRDFASNDSTFNNGLSGGYGVTEDGESGKPSERGRGSMGGGPRGRGMRRVGFTNGDVEEADRRPRRQFERHSGTGRGNEIKRDGFGRGNWGTAGDEILQDTEEVHVMEKTPNIDTQQQDDSALIVKKDNAENESEDKEGLEDKEMTLEEYEKVLEEKKKALQALKAEERKVDLDKEFESMLQLSGKKSNDDVFIKLGSERDKRREIADKEERVKKSLSINEFLRPAEGSYYNPAGRGRGRGRGFRGGAANAGGGGYSGGNLSNVLAPSIEDPGQFPTLGTK